MIKSVCVFCGSNNGRLPLYAEAAHALGQAVAARGLSLVYGGADRGLMGIVANAALTARGKVFGVIPSWLGNREIAHTGLTELFFVDSMHERKQKMVDLSDAFIAMPGGYGTLDELAEVLTWSQLGLHQKPCAILDVGNYFEPLLQFFDRGAAAGFIRPEHRNLLITDDDPERLLERLTAR